MQSKHPLTITPPWIQPLSDKIQDWKTTFCQKKSNAGMLVGKNRKIILQHFNYFLFQQWSFISLYQTPLPLRNCCITLCLTLNGKKLLLIEVRYRCSSLEFSNWLLPYLWLFWVVTTYSSSSSTISSSSNWSKKLPKAPS